MTRLLGAGVAVILLAACGLPIPRPGFLTPSRTEPSRTEPAPPAITRPEPPGRRAPAVFAADRFIVAVAQAGDTAESLAARHLGDPAKAWMIEDFNEAARFVPGQEVVIPRRPWNLSGVTASGYQLVPVLVYHDIGPQARGRLVIAARTFEEQVRHLKAQGYRVVRLADLYEFVSLRRQLPRKAVVLTFDDGFKSFLQYAYPILKELGFPATLFIDTDHVGTGLEALTWDELRALQAEGFDIQPHSKTRTDLRRRPGEPDEAFARRMQAELGQPRALFERQLGRRGNMLAYPQGYHDDAVIESVKAHGYVAAVDLLRQSNPAFAGTLRIHRSQIHADMTLDDFVKNLNVFHDEPIR